MRTFGVRLGIVVLLALLVASSAEATYSDILAYGEAVLVEGPSVELLGGLSSSYAYTEDSMGDWDEDYEEDSAPYTFASVDIDTAGAMAETDEGLVYAEAGAGPPPGEWAYAEAEAFQGAMFQIMESGEVVFGVDYEFLADLATDIFGDWAWAYAEVRIGLYDADLFPIIEDGVEVEFDIENGDTLEEWEDFGLLTVGGYFEQGEMVGAGIWAYTAVEAYTEDEDGEPRVPAPGAVLLGTIGASLVAHLRRRKAL
jgi:hypothetical protein